MIILRIYPIRELNQVWDDIVRNVAALSNEHSTPLYLSQQEEKNFLSIIYDVKDADSFGDIIVQSIPSTLNPEKTRTITLLKPVFFPAPRDRPANLERYQVALQARTNELESVFRHIVHLNYPKDVFPTYAAYSFGEDDILTSMLSVGRHRIEEFIAQNVQPETGVEHVEISRIGMSRRLAPPGMWKDYRESRYLFKPTPQYEDYDFTELAALSGAFVHEVSVD